MQGREKMSEPAFAALVRWLAPDGQAHQSYGALRERLVRLFAFWGSAQAELSADETFSRVAGRLGAGEAIRTESRFAYLRGVARNLFLEELRRRGREEVALRTLPVAATPPEVAENPRRDCQERCLAALDPDTRDLVVTYYRGQERERIERREALAARLRIGLGPLRNRMHRIREKLRLCQEQCLRDTNRRSESPI